MFSAMKLSSTYYGWVGQCNLFFCEIQEEALNQQAFVNNFRNNLVHNFYKVQLVFLSTAKTVLEHKGRLVLVYGL